MRALGNLSHFKITAKLGSGGMGEVCLVIVFTGMNHVQVATIPGSTKCCAAC